MNNQSVSMRAITFLYAVALIALGVGGYIATGSEHVTALIPAFFGAVFFVCAFLAGNPKLKKHVMHVAVLLALIAVVGGAKGVMTLPSLLTGGAVERPAAVVSQSILAVLSLVFMIFAVKSFIDARRKPA